MLFDALFDALFDSSSDTHFDAGFDEVLDADLDANFVAAFDADFDAHFNVDISKDNGIFPISPLRKSVNSEISSARTRQKWTSKPVPPSRKSFVCYRKTP